MVIIHPRAHKLQLFSLKPWTIYAKISKMYFRREVENYEAERHYPGI